MTFINEPIPEEDKKNLSSEILFVSKAKPLIDPSRWTIDRERDAFLILIGINSGGGQGDGYVPPYNFAFYSKSEVVKFDATISSVGQTKSNDLIFSWVIDNLKSSKLASITDAVVDLIKESISVAARPTHGNEGVIAVNITFKK